MTKRQSFTLFGFKLRTLLIVAALGLIGLIALGADLAFEGLVYDYLWRTTGETSPPNQILGYGQYLVSLTRDQPDTQPYVYIEHADVNPYGVNTFLDQEVELEKRERQVQIIADAGFGWIRQQFPWEDIEIHAKGDFTDLRNDLDGDGIDDPVDAWAKYDNIVDLTQRYNLQMMVRLSGPMPPWSLPEGIEDTHHPPADFQDFVDYAAAVAARYQGKIRYYQVWNEPNLYPEWGDQTVNAEAYTELLCRTHDALKAIDPDIVVITGALGPTIDLSGRNAYDLLYLQRMYQAGAGDCFDILSVQGYGLWSGPTDHRLRQTTINYQRHLWIRDMMVANGDAHKAIWISEAGWNPVPNDPTINDLERYGRVTMDEAAEWAPLAYERAAEEWPWVGVINWWYFKRADDRERGDSWFYFRLLEPDFTPTPVFESLKTYMTAHPAQTLGVGRWGIEHRGISQSTEAGMNYRFRWRGTGLYVCYDAAPDAQTIAYGLDGERPQPLTIPADQAGCLAVATGRAPGEHTLSLTTDSDHTLNSIVIEDYGWRHRLPWLLTGIVAVLVAGGVIVSGVLVWSRSRRI